MVYCRCTQAFGRISLDTQRTLDITQIAYRYGQRSHEVLQTAGANVHFKTYPGVRHFTSYDELADVQGYFLDILPARVASPS